MNDSKKARVIKPSTEKKLFALSKNQCYKPNCTNKLITDDKKDVLAKIAHIEAASPNGPRYNPNMTDDERRDFNNLILLCDEHHIEIDSHPNEFPTELLKEWKMLHEGTDGNLLFKHTLKEKYLNHFNTISLLTTNTPKPIDEIFINLAIIKEQKEEKNKENLINREAHLSSYEEIHNPKEPIEIKELINTANKSLIYGKAGIGKTTLCKYIAYKWAKEELYSEFEYVVYIPLREWKNNGIKGAIKDYYYSRDSQELTFDIKAQKILFLFDGYDELNGDKKKALIKEIEHYALTHYIITSRPYGYQKSDFRVDEQFETIGFTDENVEEYIEAFFKKNSEKSKGLKEFLQTNISIKHIAYIPLMLEMICSLWEEEEFSDSLTMTELYSQSIENIFFEYTEKNGTAYIQDKEEEIFNYLGKIAFEGLKQQTIVLDKSIIKEKRTFFSDYVLKTGFLNDGKAEKNNPLLNSYQFPHLTFQEYFSALYVSKLSPNEQSEIIRDWKFYPHMQVFFAFLGGLIKDKEFLLKEIESEPRDILGVYEFKLISLCLEEIKSETLLRERKIRIFKKFFSNLKIMSYNIGLGLSSIAHLIDDDFMKIFIEESEDKKNNVSAKVDVYAIVSELLKENTFKFTSLFIKYLADKQISDKFREKLFSVLKNDSSIVNNKFNQDTRLIEIFLNEDDNSNIQKNLVSLLIQIARENHRNGKSNDNIIDGFINKFKIIKNNTNSIMSLASISKGNEKVKNHFISTIHNERNNRKLIAKIADAFTIMKNDDNSEIIEILIGIVNSKEKSAFRTYIALALLKLEDDVSNFFESLIELIYDEDIDIYDRAKIASYLMFRGLNEEKFKKLFFKLINQEEVKNKFNWAFLVFSRNKIRYISFLEIDYIGKELLTKIFIDILQHPKIEDYIKKNIVKFLFNHSKHSQIDEELIETFFKIIKNENIDNNPRLYLTNTLFPLAKYVPSFLNQIDEELIDAFFKMIENDKNNMNIILN